MFNLSSSHELKDPLIRFGVLSTATIANKVVDAIHKSKHASVVAVGSRSLEKAKQFAKKNGIPKIYGSYDQVIADEEVNAVYIPLPSAFKAEWAVKVANAKKHVLCEKPFYSLQDLKLIIDACNNNGVHFMDCTMWVHHTRSHIMKDLVLKKNEIGAIQRVNCSFGMNLTGQVNNIRLDPNLERGAIGDIGWYCIKAILWAYDWNLPTKVFSSARFINDVPWDCTTILWFSDHRMATFDCSFKSAKRQMFTIHGSEKCLEVRDGCFFPYYCEPFEFPDNVHQGLYDEKSHYVLIDSNGREKHFEVSPCVQVVEMIDNFARDSTDIEHGNKLKTDWSFQSLQTQTVLDAILESSASESIIKFDSVA